MTFTGFPKAALAFYEGLATDNSRTFWMEHKSEYEKFVRAPMDALLEELPEFGPFRVFRPYNDARFAKGRPTYKENIGAYGESEGGAGFYVALSLGGMYIGSGYYGMAADQLERFRAAIDADGTGNDLAARCVAATHKGLTLTAMGELKTAPRGYSKDHPRIELLRRKGLVCGREYPVAKWLHTKATVGKVRDVWCAAADVNEWLDLHVGPSTLPPEEFR
ncbi:MAG: DUF2461 domain-containing protein [Actinomycetota bacterium]